MDDWKVNDRLTVNLGVRWEGVPHAYDTKDWASNFNPSLYNLADAPQWVVNSSGVRTGAMVTTGPGFGTVANSPLPTTPFYINGLSFAGQNGTPAGLVKNSWDTFAPRIGFAYDLTGRHKTILRAGAGRFFERLAGNEMYNLIQNSVPYAYSTGTSNVYLDNPAVSWATGANAGLSPYTPNGQTLWSITQGYKVPSSLQWSLGIQQQLANNATVSVSYVGNQNMHQSEGININPISPSDTTDRLAVCGATCGYTGSPATANYYRPYQGWGNISSEVMGANSNYNSLQISLRTMEWKNITLQESYTWSHVFDIIDGEIFSNVSNPFNAHWDYGPAGFDRRQMSITSFIYKIPVFKDSTNHIARTAVGGWTLSGILTLESGNPLTVGSQNDNLGFGGNTSNRANIVAPITYTGTRFQWFSTSSFAEPAALQWGTASRNDVVGPGRNNWNMALYKAFQFGERAKFEFRVESFNTFNHTQLQNPNTSFGSTQFGQITGTYQPRIFQFGLKFLF
jgi:hypothetical protein